MDSSNCVHSSVTDTDSIFLEDQHFQSQNQLDDRMNEISQNKFVTDKNKLEKALHPASLLDASVVCEKKSAENIELNNKDNFKITPDYPNRNDGDKVEIVDNVASNSNPQEINSSELPLKSVILNPAEVCSASTENMSDVEFKSINDTEVCEGEVRIMTNKTLDNDVCPDPVTVLAESELKDCTLLSSSKTDSVSVNSILTNSDSNSNHPKICITEKTVDNMECDIPSGSVTCDDIIDLTNETDECSSYDIEYDFNHTPTQITGSWKEFSSGKRNNFTRGCKWYMYNQT